MNVPLIIPELVVIGLALAILLIDLWTPPHLRPRLGWLVIVGLAVALGLTFSSCGACSPETGFGDLFVLDDLAIYFKRFFLIAAILVVLLGIEFSDRIPVAIGEFYVLVLLAVAGMMFAASANDFILVFVALELITVSFYVLVSFQRSRSECLEAGVKYLIMGALSTAFLIFGIALLFATANTTDFTALSAASTTLANDRLFWLGLLLILVGLSFKLAVFPLQMWAPDVYQGAPTPVTAFLAIASKAAGFVILLRILFVAVPYIARQWTTLFMVAAAISILYGNLCAIPQRSLKRLLGYSSISHAGYLMLGVAALDSDGAGAILYYLTGYLFTLGAAFTVICLVCRQSDDINSLAGLSKRSPVLAAGMAMAMASLGGIPPLAGFAGKFLLFKGILQQGPGNHAYYWVAFVAIVGVIISLYYYFGVIRTIYWPGDIPDASRIPVSAPMKISLAACMIGMIYLGLFPNSMLVAAALAVKELKF